jgi:hypothetical protein
VSLSAERRLDTPNVSVLIGVHDHVRETEAIKMAGQEGGLVSAEFEQQRAAGP